MKNKICLIALAIFFLSCSPSKQTLETSSPQKVKVSQQNTFPSFKGKWTVVSYSAFMDASKIPNYKAGDVVWDFGSNDSHYSTMTISKKNTVDKNDQTLGAGEVKFWLNDYVIKLGGQMYLYTFNHHQARPGHSATPLAPGTSASDMGTTLKLDSNIDPSYGADNTVIYLEKID